MLWFRDDFLTRMRIMRRRGISPYTAVLILPTVAYFVNIFARVLWFSRPTPQTPPDPDEWLLDHVFDVLGAVIDLFLVGMLGLAAAVLVFALRWATVGRILPPKAVASPTSQTGSLLIVSNLMSVVSLLAVVVPLLFRGGDDDEWLLATVASSASPTAPGSVPAASPTASFLRAYLVIVGWGLVKGHYLFAIVYEPLYEASTRLPLFAGRTVEGIAAVATAVVGASVTVAFAELVCSVAHWSQWAVVDGLAHMVTHGVLGLDGWTSILPLVAGALVSYITLLDLCFSSDVTATHRMARHIALMGAQFAERDAHSAASRQHTEHRGGHDEPRGLGAEVAHYLRSAAAILDWAAIGLNRMQGVVAADVIVRKHWWLRKLLSIDVGGALATQQQREVIRLSGVAMHNRWGGAGASPCQRWVCPEATGSHLISCFFRITVSVIAVVAVLGAPPISSLFVCAMIVVVVPAPETKVDARGNAPHLLLESLLVCTHLDEGPALVAMPPRYDGCPWIWAMLRAAFQGRLWNYFGRKDMTLLAQLHPDYLTLHDASLLPVNRFASHAAVLVRAGGSGAWSDEMVAPVSRFVGVLDGALSLHVDTEFIAMRSSMIAKKLGNSAAFLELLNAGLTAAERAHAGCIAKGKRSSAESPFPVQTVRCFARFYRHAALSLRTEWASHRTRADALECLRGDHSVALVDPEGTTRLAFDPAVHCRPLILWGLENFERLLRVIQWEEQPGGDLELEPPTISLRRAGGPQLEVQIEHQHVSELQAALDGVRIEMAHFAGSVLAVVNGVVEDEQATKKRREAHGSGYTEITFPHFRVPAGLESSTLCLRNIAGIFIVRKARGLTGAHDAAHPCRLVHQVLVYLRNRGAEDAIRSFYKSHFVESVLEPRLDHQLLEALDPMVRQEFKRQLPPPCYPITGGVAMHLMMEATASAEYHQPRAAMTAFYQLEFACLLMREIRAVPEVFDINDTHFHTEMRRWRLGSQLITRVARIAVVSKRHAEDIATITTQREVEGTIGLVRGIRTIPIVLLHTTVLALELLAHIFETWPPALMPAKEIAKAMREPGSFISLVINQFGITRRRADRGLGRDPATGDDDGHEHAAAPFLDPGNPADPALRGAQPPASGSRQQLGRDWGPPEAWLMPWLSGPIRADHTKEVSCLQSDLLAACARLQPLLLSNVEFPSGVCLARLVGAPVSGSGLTFEYLHLTHDTKGFSIDADEICSVCFGSLGRPEDEDGEEKGVAVEDDNKSCCRAAASGSTPVVIVGQLEKCGHVFHKACAFLWLSSHNNCPVCRAPVTAQ